MLGRAEAHERRRSPVADVWRLARTGVAHVPEDRGLFFDLTAAENLRLGRPRARRRRVPMEQILDLVPRAREGARTARPACCRAASSRCWRWPGP